MRVLFFFFFFYHYTSSVIHIYIFTNIWKIENNHWKYQNKGDNNWHQTSNNYACWHNIHIFVCIFLSIMHLFLEVEDQRCSADVCVSWTEHALCPPPVHVLFLVLLASILLFFTPVRHPKTPTEQSERRKSRSSRISLSTAIDKDDFFVAFGELCDSCVSVIERY